MFLTVYDVSQKMSDKEGAEKERPVVMQPCMEILLCLALGGTRK